MKRALISILSIALVVVLCSCSFTTAHFTNLNMTSEIDENYKPLHITDTFTSYTPMIYVTGTLKNAPDGTEIKTEWNYIDNDNDDVVFIDSATYTAKDYNTDFYFSLSKPYIGWPAGEYFVQLFIDDELEETITFTVK